MSIHGHVGALHGRATSAGKPMMMTFVLGLREQSLWKPFVSLFASGKKSVRPAGQSPHAEDQPVMTNPYDSTWLDSKPPKHSVQVAELMQSSCMQQSAVGRSSPASADVPRFRSSENALLHSRMGAVPPPACPAF